MTFSRLAFDTQLTVIDTIGKVDGSLWFTCERLDKVHVRQFSHFNCKRKTCSAEYQNIEQTRQIHSGLSLHKQHGHGKKRLKIKIPSLSINDCKKHKPMSDPLQPTSNHVSYGGQFNISSSDEDPFEEWRRQNGEAASSDEPIGTRHSQVPPDFRTWESVDRRNSCVHGSPFQFKVLSYNVLAQYLLESHPYLYTGCSPRNLKWKIRASRLYDEIMSYSPDILCFQEVQVSHLQSFYSKFEQTGYFGIFKQKTGHRQDGCAIYFKRSLFDIKDHVTVEFYQPALPILNRDNIGLMVKLVPKQSPNTPVVVATTHLLYNPKRTDVRLAQMQVLLAEIDRFAYYDNGQESGHLPIILTGDFNSTPDSAVIKLLDRGCVPASPFRDSSDWKSIGVTDNCQHLSVYLNRKEGRTTDLRNVKIYNSERSESSSLSSASERSRASPTEVFSDMFNTDVIRHSLRLVSVYDRVKPGNMLEATTNQEYWLTVDYIYFSYRSSLKLVERLRLPTAPECEVLGSLPNDVYGSDHLALAATFQLAPYRSAL